MSKSEIAAARRKVQRRNLVLRGEVIQYTRRISGEFVRWSTKTGDWEEAAAIRDAWEKREGVGTLKGGAPRRSDRWTDCAPSRW